MQFENDQEHQKTEKITPIKGAKFSDHHLPKFDARAQTGPTFDTRTQSIKSIAGRLSGVIDVVDYRGCTLDRHMAI